MDITNMNKKLQIKYYKAIISTLKKQNDDYMWVEDHINSLENDNIESSDTVTIEEVPQVDINEDHYKKPWTKLNIIHKILKMKEYISSLKNTSNKNKEELKEQLCQLIKDKTLTKKEKINYDMVNCKIISLLDLQYKNDKYVYLV